MSLQYIIDGYNIINHRLFPRLPRKIRSSPASLVTLIKTGRLCGSPKNSAVVVFDGYPPDSKISKNDGQVSIVFSEDSSADDVIKRMTEKARDPKNTIVVSDDKEIVSFVRLCGIKTEAVAEFIGKDRGSAGFSRPGAGDDSGKELNFSQMSSINDELRRKWLK